MRWYVFFNEVKKGRWHPDKILVSWDVSVYYVGQKVALASFLLSLKHPGHDPGVGAFLLRLGAGLGCGASCRQVQVLGSDVSFSVYKS